MESSSRVVSLFCLLLWLLLGSCNNIDVRADYDPEVNFSGLRSYAWIEADLAAGADPRAGNQLIHGRITLAIEHELNSMGIALNAEAPDFRVGFSSSVKSETEIYSEPFYFGGYGLCRSYGGFGLSYGASINQVVHETDLLQIDFVNPTAKRLIWRGSARSRFVQGRTPEQSTKHIQKTVAKILTQFPPKTP